MEKQLLRGAIPRVFSTLPDDPEEGRVFVWSKIGWFERDLGESGVVAFEPVADSEEQLRDWLVPQGAESLEELDDDFAELVRDEFLEQTPLYLESPELSDEPPGEDVDYESEHLHVTTEEEDREGPRL